MLMITCSPANLGDAIRGKLVKDPLVGTEADVDFTQFDPDSIETDARKLQLAACKASVACRC